MMLMAASASAPVADIERDYETADAVDEGAIADLLQRVREASAGSDDSHGSSDADDIEGSGDSVVLKADDTDARSDSRSEAQCEPLALATILPLAIRDILDEVPVEEPFEATRHAPCEHNVWVRVRRLRRQPGVHLRCHICDARWQTLIEFHEKCSGFYSGKCAGDCGRPHIYARGIVPAVVGGEGGDAAQQAQSLRSLKNGRTRTRRSKPKKGGSGGGGGGGGVAADTQKKGGDVCLSRTPSSVTTTSSSYMTPFMNSLNAPFAGFDM